MQLFANSNYAILNKRKIWYVLSGVIILIGIVAIVLQGGLKYSIDFSGGLSLEIVPLADSLGNTINVAQVRETLTKNGIAFDSIQELEGPPISFLIKRKGEAAENLIINIMPTTDTTGTTLSIEQIEDTLIKNGVNDATITELPNKSMSIMVAAGMMSDDEIPNLLQKVYPQFTSNEDFVHSITREKVKEMIGDDIVRTLQEEFPEYTNHPDFIYSQEEVGPRAGADLRKQAVTAVLIALVFILIYIWIRFRFTWGIMAAIALFHDVIIALGVLSIFGIEIGMTILAALLTIVGYSINNTIVIFDRIRENLKLYRKDDDHTIINRSINEVLSRTLLTSFTTLLANVALIIWGGPVIRGFAFTFMVGIIVGTFSSLCVSTGLIYDTLVAIKNRAKKK